MGQNHTLSIKKTNKIFKTTSHLVEAEHIIVFVTEFFDATEVVQAQIKSASIEFVYAVDKRTRVT